MGLHYDLLVAQDEDKGSPVIRIHHVCTINICRPTKMYGIPSNKLLRQRQKSQRHVGTREKVSGSPKSHIHVLWRT